MTKRKFTLDDIKNYLLELGFIWEDKTIYNTNTRLYNIARISTFDKNVFLSMKQSITNRSVLMLATINNETFELWCDNSKMDATDGWLEYLAQKENKVTV